MSATNKTIMTTFRDYLKLVILGSLLVAVSPFTLAQGSQQETVLNTIEADDKETTSGTICLLLPQFCRSEAQ